MEPDTFRYAWETWRDQPFASVVAVAAWLGVVVVLLRPDRMRRTSPADGADGARDPRSA